MRRKLAIFAAVLLTSIGCLAQAETSAKNKKGVPAAVVEQQVYRSSAAYAELLLRRTELSSGLEAMVLEYTEEYPKVQEIRHVLTLIDRESARLAKVKTADASRLTLALGKLIVRKIELETDLWGILKNYKEEHPDVKRAKRKVDIYETAISEILN